MAGGATFNKRQKERSRQDRQREKLERKQQRAAEKQQSGGSGPEIDWNHSQAELMGNEPAEDEPRSE